MYFFTRVDYKQISFFQYKFIVQIYLKKVQFYSGGKLLNFPELFRIVSAGDFSNNEIVKEREQPLSNSTNIRFEGERTMNYDSILLEGDDIYSRFYDYGHLQMSDNQKYFNNEYSYHGEVKEYNSGDFLKLIPKNTYDKYGYHSEITGTNGDDTIDGNKTWYYVSGAPQYNVPGISDKIHGGNICTL